MNKTGMITPNQLKNIQSELKLIEDKKAQMLKEQERLTTLYVQQRELTEKIGKFIMEEHAFATYKDFIAWYNRKPNLTPTSTKPVNKGLIWKPSLAVKKNKNNDVNENDLTLLFVKLHTWMNLKDLDSIAVSQLLGKPDTYIEDLYDKTITNKTDAQLKNLIDIYTGILDELNTIEPLHDTEIDLNMLLSLINKWVTKYNITKSKTSRLLGRADTYINNLEYKVKNATSEHNILNMQDLLINVITSLNQLNITKPRYQAKNVVYDKDTLDTMAEEIDEWLFKHNLSKASLSEMNGYTKSYLNQQYTNMHKQLSPRQLDSTAKALDNMLTFIRQCDNPLGKINLRYFKYTTFIIMIKTQDAIKYVYYAKNQPLIDSDDYLDFQYTDVKYDAKLLDKESIIKFYTNFIKEHPEVNITVLPVTTSDLSYYQK